MKNTVLFSVFVFVLLSFARQRVEAQCYVRLEDASGFNTDPYQSELEAAAAKLCAIFDTTGFAGQFKVYDFGFYLHQEHTTGGYPQPFAQKIAQVQALSPYYLLFGKQTDKTGVYTRFWVDLVLPDTGRYACVSVDRRRVLFEYIIASMYESYNANARSPAAYYLSEINALNNFINTIKKDVDCCFSRFVDCATCVTLDESVFILKNSHGIDIKKYELIQILGDTCIESNSFCDYILTNESFCPNFDSNIAKQQFLNIVSEFGCHYETDNPEFVTFDPNNQLMVEEPKWGQLATCGDIMIQVNSLDLSGLSLKKQSERISNHFDCSTFYTRDTEGCLIYDFGRDFFCRTPRYAYSSVYGWIDFHHVFKIFEWAVEQEEGGSGLTLIQAANLAEIKGYQGEVYQWLKGNESGFSYEDLCSNHVGAMFFINHYESLKNNQNTWNGALSFLCTEISFKNPSEAPNYDYIPHVLDGNLPRIFNDTNCLTGEDLKTKHKNSFKKKSLRIQMGIKQAHFEFSH